MNAMRHFRRKAYFLLRSGSLMTGCFSRI